MNDSSFIVGASVRHRFRLAAIALVASVWAGTAVAQGPDAADTPEAGPTSEADWINLFNGRSLAGWTVTNFGGEGDVTVENEAIFMDFGSSLTGITFDATAAGIELPASDYELELEAARVAGTDFFCGLTFPVAESHCSLIVGGWGGALVGLSSLDGNDAARNETQLSMKFERDVWYPIRVRVEPERIGVWIGDRQVIDQALKGRQLSVRPEVELSKPLGICAWETQAKLRKIRLRRID